jgi:hypothetical protein
MNSHKDIVVVPPAYESLFDIRRADSIWPKSILNNSTIQKEIRSRKHLFECLKKVFGILSPANTEITAAIDTGTINPLQAEELYVELVKFFEAKEYNKRLVLYLPFEIIPNVTWQPNSKSLAQAIFKFHSVYLSVWRDLLSHQDVKACFTDGDILEPEITNGRPLPKVVKAAHLAWALVDKGLISVEEIIFLIESNREDELLRQCLCDSIKVMYDLGLVKDFNLLSNSSDNLLKKLSLELGAQAKASEETKLSAFVENLEQLEKFVLSIYDELTNIENELTNLSRKISPERAEWLLQKNIQEAINKFAGQISFALMKESITLNEFKEFSKNHIHDEFLFWIAIETIGKFLETLAKEDLESARTAYQELKPILEVLNSFNNWKIDFALEGIFLRLSYLGVVGQERIIFPGEKFLLERAVNHVELGKLINITEAIGVDKNLSKMLYPVLFLYGSKVKGYGSKDFDLAIMVRPWVALNSRAVIQDALSGIIKNLGIKATFLEFWLKWESGHLNIRDFENPDGYMCGNDIAHVLFEAACVGKIKNIGEMFDGLVSQFLMPEAEGIVQAIKPLLLKEMERNTLQFRLMHKGYAHMYPSIEGIPTRNSSAIGGAEGSFWDSGYRQLATKLFVTRVFLP